MRLIALGVLVLFISGCVSTEKLRTMPENDLYNFKRGPVDIKRKYRAELVRRHPEWDSGVKEKILEGRVDIGMTKKQVLSSVGKPAETLGRAPSADDDESVWVYKDQYLEFTGDQLTAIFIQKEDLSQE